MAYTTTPVPVLLLFFFFIAFIIITVGGACARTEKTANSSTSIIRLGSWLSPNTTTTTTSWASSSGHFAFGFYQQQRSSNNTGFAVGIWLVSPQNTTTTIVWTANRDDHSPLPSNSMLNLTTHGLLLLQNGKKSKLIHDSLSMPGVVASASMHDSGNFVLCDKHSNVVWESFDYPTDTILGGQNLPSDYNLVSSISKSDHSSGYFYLTIDYDGNLLSYPSNSQGRAEDAYWDSYADGALKVNLSLNVQGSLCIGGINDAYRGDYSRAYRGDYSRAYRDDYSRTYRQYSRSSSSGYGPDSRPLPVPCFTSTDDRNNKSVAVLQHNTTSSTSTLIYRATLEVNGNFILYEHQFDEGNSNTTYKMLWQAMNDTSRIFAFCGFNSYWFGDAAVCQCFPGFIPAASNTKTSSSSSTNILLKNCEQKMTMTMTTHNSKADCESSDQDPMMMYNVTLFHNMTFGDIPYVVMPMKEKENCEKACLEDCDCWGAFYNKSSGICNKHRLPFIYARIHNQNDYSTVAIIKIPNSELIVASPPPTSNANDDDQKKLVVIVDNKRHIVMILAFTLGSICLLSLVFAVSVFFNYQRQVYKYTALSESCSDQNLGFTQDYSLLRSFSFEELVRSTGDFAEEIGRGSFGAVYRGTIGGDSNKKIIAVKRLERICDDEGEREFRAEVTAIARTHHRNLVKLVGFCIDGSRKLLVYEYLSNGSLAKHLFELGEQLMNWKERIRIAMDVARGLLYLHEECEERIIHCNINPRNILMDEAWTAKISDFGLARLLKRQGRYSRMDDAKSGYLAPEWKEKEKEEDASSVLMASVKADVYSFGMVLLEIVCRRSNIETNVSSPDQILLSSWVYQCFAEGKLNKLLITHYNDEQDINVVDWKIVERMVKVGLWCVQHHPSLRPSMQNVILMLEGLKDIPVPPSPSAQLP